MCIVLSMQGYCSRWQPSIVAAHKRFVLEGFFLVFLFFLCRKDFCMRALCIGLPAAAAVLGGGGVVGKGNGTPSKYFQEGDIISLI